MPYLYTPWAVASEHQLSPDELKKIPLFRDLSDEQRRQLVELFHPVGVTGTLFSPGDEAKALYLLRKGTVTLSRDGDDDRHLKPLALIGELGALTGGRRTSQATVKAGCELWAAQRRELIPALERHPGLSAKIHASCVAVTAEKIERDQKRISDMRRNLMRTQRGMKELLQFVLESQDTTISDRVHTVLSELIRQNRRVNYRVSPPPVMQSYFTLDTPDQFPVVEISRTHFSYKTAPNTLPSPGTRVTGVLGLSGPEIPVQGLILRTIDRRVDVKLDMLVDSYIHELEGYLTRVQMLDYLV